MLIFEKLPWKANKTVEIGSKLLIECFFSLSHFSRTFRLFLFEVYGEELEIYANYDLHISTDASFLLHYTFGNSFKPTHSHFNDVVNSITVFFQINFFNLTLLLWVQIRLKKNNVINEAQFIKEICLRSALFV